MPQQIRIQLRHIQTSLIIQYVAAVVLVLVTYTNATKASLSKTDVSNHKVTYNLSIQKMREGMRKPHYLAESDIFIV
jgi:hypothetical protein